jgi:hypothetical protein
MAGSVDRRPPSNALPLWALWVESGHLPGADSAMVRCSECGHEIGTMDELKERVAGEVMRRANPSASDQDQA